MNLHDLQVPEEGALANPRLPYGAGGPIDTQDYFTPEMLEDPYRYYEPQVQRLRYTYTYRLAGETTWRLPERAEGVFLNEQT